MFVPYTLFLYIVFRFYRLRYILLSAFLLSVGIEVTQYVTGVGFPDIDDVIFNSFGAFLAILIIKGLDNVNGAS